MPGFAFFDLDHTLLPFDTQVFFANFVLQRERWRTAYLPFVFPFAFLRACRLVRTVTLKRAFMSHLAGMKRDTLLACAKEFADQAVKPWIYPELAELIAAHRGAGRVLVMNTASPDFYANEIARVLGMDHCIATRVELSETMPLMPRVIGENNKHQAKIGAMKTAMPELAGVGTEALRDSWAYSDSAADLPLLEFAGHGVLIHPNAALEAIGLQRGWQVLRPPRPYEGRGGDMLCAVRQALGIFTGSRPRG